MCRLRTDGGSKNKTLQKFVFFVFCYIQTDIHYVSHEFDYPEGEILTPFKSGSVLNARQQSPADDGTWGAHANSRQQTTGK